MKVCYLVLVYNNIVDTLETLDGIKFQKYSGIDTVIIDNNSSQECVDAIKKYAAENSMEYIRRSINDGYSGGNNFGWSLLRQKYEFIFVVNNDIVFNDAFLTSKIVQLFASDDRIGVVGPRTLYRDNRIIKDSPVMSFFFNKIYNRKFLEKAEYRECPSVIGCFLAIRTKAVSEDYLFDESFFMYSEELDFSLRIWNNNYSVVCLNNASSTIYHKGGCDPFDRPSAWKYYLTTRNSVLCSRNFKWGERVAFVFLILVSVLKKLFFSSHSFRNRCFLLLGFISGLRFLLCRADFSVIKDDALRVLSR